jgi:hypothetical protein
VESTYHNHEQSQACKLRFRVIYFLTAVDSTSGLPENLTDGAQAANTAAGEVVSPTKLAPKAIVIDAGIVAQSFPAGLTGLHAISPSTCLVGKSGDPYDLNGCHTRAPTSTQQTSSESSP